MTPEELTPGDFATIDLIERLCSALSLIGCAFIAITFLGSTAFRKPINRLVFYACLGNVFTNVATLIARAPVNETNSFLCQFQGLLIQMFLPADACWAFAMALNIWLTFYRKYDAERIRRLEIVYFVLCYGIPFIPGFVFIFIQTQSKGRMYGNATLWCWVSSEWDLFRLVTFYVPVWVVIGFTLAIYVRAGRDIYANRKRLLKVSNEYTTSHISTMDNPFHASKTTEISFASEAVDKNKNVEGGGFEMGMPGDQVSKPSPVAHSPYSVTVSTGPDPRTRFDIESGNNDSPNNFEMSPTVRFPAADTQRTHQMQGHRAATQTDNANWAYVKVAGLFFVALMVTWIPSSANRVYSYVHPGEISLGLEYASAFVLPLQGFWNGIIYATTSLPACKSFFRELRARKLFNRKPLRRVSNSFSPTTENLRRPASSRGGPFTEIDSLTSIESRPTSREKTRN